MPASTSSSSRRASSSAENKKAQDRWSKEEEKLLVQPWAEKHDQLESRESGKTWAWIAEKISKTLGTNKTADKCIRKIKYIIERYKNAKDWNKNQTGGSLRKSVYYDEIDKILGCRDVVTFNHVAEAGISGESATEINAGPSVTTGEISTSSSPSVPETPAESRRASKKGKRASKHFFRFLVLWFCGCKQRVKAASRGIAGNHKALTAWCCVLFTDFVLKCDCSLPDTFFLTGRFQVGFVQNKSEIAL